MERYFAPDDVGIYVLDEDCRELKWAKKGWERAMGIGKSWGSTLLEKQGNFMIENCMRKWKNIQKHQVKVVKAWKNG